MTPISSMQNVLAVQYLQQVCAVVCWYNAAVQTCRSLCNDGVA
jgi:hypothetical protein